MKNIFKSRLSIIIPNKKINLFTIFIIVLGIISGSIFLIALKDTDKGIIVNKITNFMTKINSNDINNIKAFKNAICENGIYIFTIWLLGFSIIGIIANVFLTYLRGFIVGFTISSFIHLYKFKGILAAFIYAFPTTIINLLVTFLISVYSFTFTIYLIKSIFNKTNNILIKNYLKKYFIILLISFLMIFISSLTEAFLLPSIMKLVIKLFI